MKMLFIEQQKIATSIADIFSDNQKNIYIKKGSEIKKEFEQQKFENFFPTIDTIYDKKYIQELERENNNNKKYNNNREYYYQPSSPINSYTKKNKINKYSSPQFDKYSEYIDDDNNNKLIRDMDGNEEEYILVRQPSRHKKKYGGSNKNIYKKNHYYKKNCKLKFTLEKYKIKYNIREEEINNNKHKLSEFTETISGYNTNESSSLNNQQDEIDSKKNYYKFSKKSRFSFANTENDEKNEKFNNFMVPDFIKDILTKKFYTLSFMSSSGYKNNKYLEEFLLDEEIKALNKWAKE
jgi:hypothetical protein